MRRFIIYSVNILEGDERDLLIAALASTSFEGVEETETGIEVSVDETCDDVMDFLQEKNIAFNRKSIDQKNWNALWEASYPPVHIFNADRPLAQIRAAFHEKVASFPHDIVITPKMSFGTGHHATTSLMIEAISELELNGKSILDLGTGTGVLAIFAQQRGAAAITATDNDANSIENARENFFRNDVTVSQLDLRDDVPRGKFDLIFANIILQTIIDLLPQMCAALAKQGSILFSGVMISDETSLTEAVSKNNLTITAVKMRGDWLMMRAQFNEAGL